MVSAPDSQFEGIGFNRGKRALLARGSPSMLSLRGRQMAPASAVINGSALRIRPSRGTTGCALKIDAELTIFISNYFYALGYHCSPTPIQEVQFVCLVV